MTLAQANALRGMDLDVAIGERVYGLVRHETLCAWGPPEGGTMDDFVSAGHGWRPSSDIALAHEAAHKVIGKVGPTKLCVALNEVCGSPFFVSDGPTALRVFCEIKGADLARLLLATPEQWSRACLLALDEGGS